jgi:hypothetical protein
MDLDSQPSSRGFRQAFLYLKRILIKSSNVDKVAMVEVLG